MRSLRSDTQKEENTWLCVANAAITGKSQRDSSQETKTKGAHQLGLRRNAPDGRWLHQDSMRTCCLALTRSHLGIRSSDHP